MTFISNRTFKNFFEKFIVQKHHFIKIIIVRNYSKIKYFLIQIIAIILPLESNSTPDFHFNSLIIMAIMILLFFILLPFIRFYQVLQLPYFMVIICFQFYEFFPIKFYYILLIMILYEGFWTTIFCSGRGFCFLNHLLCFI